MPLDNSLGGAGATPGSFVVVGQSPTILVQGANTVVDAMTITVTEQIYGVTFSFTVPLTVWKLSQTSTAQEGVASLASQYAAAVQVIGEYANTVAISYAQDVNAAGLLVDVLIVTVGTPDGTQTTNVTVPLLTAGTPAGFDLITTAYANLVAVGALT